MGLLTNPLDAVLSSTSKVRLLRLLVEQNRTVSGREAARLTRTSRTAILVAIDDLAKLGVIDREKSGRQFLCRVNQEHELVQRALIPLFSVEAEWPTVIFSAVREALATAQKTTPGRQKQTDILAVWFFGSAATGRDIPGSDLDLFVLARSDDTLEPLLDLLTDHLRQWQQRFGVAVRPIAMSYQQVKTQLHSGNRFLIEAIRHARVISGEIPRELTVGKKNSHKTSR